MFFGGGVTIIVGSSPKANVGNHVTQWCRRRKKHALGYLGLLLGV